MAHPSITSTTCHRSGPSTRADRSSTTSPSSVSPTPYPSLSGLRPSRLGRPRHNRPPPSGGKKKTLYSLTPPSPSSSRLWGQREGKLPSYDSRVHGLMRLLGTSPAPSSRFPHPPPFFPVCRPVRLSSLVISLSFLCRRTGPPRTDPKWSRHGLSWMAQQWSQLWLPSRPGLAA